MRRREELLIQLQQAEKQLTLSAKAIRGQDMMIRWLEFDGHLDIAETARRVRQAFVKAHSAHVARHYQLLIDLVCLNATEQEVTLPHAIRSGGDPVRGKILSRLPLGEIRIAPDATNPSIGRAQRYSSRRSGHRICCRLDGSPPRAQVFVSAGVEFPD
jgi:hypothetical protein